MFQAGNIRDALQQAAAFGATDITAVWREDK